MANSTDSERNLAKHSEPSPGINQARSDDDDVPAAAEREAQGSHSSSGLPLFKANPSLSPSVRTVDPSDGVPSEGRFAHALPPEADGANPLTLAPSDPMRESEEGQPYLDDANPYGRPLVNRQNQPMGGVGTEVDPNEEERPYDRAET